MGGVGAVTGAVGGAGAGVGKTLVKKTGAAVAEGKALYDAEQEADEAEKRAAAMEKRVGAHKKKHKEKESGH